MNCVTLSMPDADAAGLWPVFHQHRLPQAVFQPLGNHARWDIHRAARRANRDQAQAATWPCWLLARVLCAAR